MIEEFKKLVDESGSILITSHLGPDADAVSSVLLLGKTLRTNYPDKNISLGLEEEAAQLDFVDLSDIKVAPLAGLIRQSQPNLLIILDANNIARCTREPDAVRKELEAGIKLAIIDHHQPDDKDKSDVYINQGSPAVAQDIYEICFEQMELKRPTDYADLAMLGIYTDTGGFVYDNPRHEKTLAIVSKLIDDGADIEKLDNQLRNYSEDEMLAFAQLVGNIKSVGNCTYSSIDDDFSAKWQAAGKSWTDLKGGCEVFVNDFVRNIGGRTWGFIVYPDLTAPVKTYSVSFRSLGDTKDVSKIAQALGGGGHKPAAGAKVEADSLDEALKIVLDKVK